MVNDYRAPVKWYKGDQEIPDDKLPDQKLTVEKDFLGNCRLIIAKAVKEDSGLYKCKIEGTKSVTRVQVTFEGSGQNTKEDFLFVKCVFDKLKILLSNL